MKKILIVLAILFLAAQISICAKQQNAKINVLTSDEESSNIVLVSCNTKETQELRDEIIDIKKQEKSEEVMPNYDIPLDKDIQQYLYDKCKEYEVPYELALSIIKVESNFNPDTVNKNSDGSKDKGLMQINSIHREEFLKQGYTSMLDPYENIAYGVSLLSEICKLYNNEHKILMSYNFGITGARKVMSRGITSSKYSRKVVEYKNNLIAKE
jgi:hypothetical protein